MTRNATWGIEAERKFLADIVGSLPEHRQLDIYQTYLIEPDGERSRIRKCGEKGHFIYYQTKKKDISPYQRHEWERDITQEEYENMMAFADPGRQTIHKVRHCIAWDNRTLELDVFISPVLPHCLLEIEHVTEKTLISFPPFLRVLREVTEDPSFRNSNIATLTQ